LSVLANCWKERFAPRQGSGQGGEAPHFFYTIPSKTLAPKVAQPTKIKGKSTACEIGGWSMTAEQVSQVIDRIVNEAYAK
ncbi:MAG: hypothetical protein ACYTGV_15195, partial [Planctomycetota bacterium]